MTYKKNSLQAAAISSGLYEGGQNIIIRQREKTIENVLS
jgi:hypothetical protein